MKLINVAPDELDLSPELVRSGSAKSFEERLRSSIDEIGLAEPLKVAYRPTGGYLVIDGAMRLRRFGLYASRIQVASFLFLRTRSSMNGATRSATSPTFTKTYSPASSQLWSSISTKPSTCSRSTSLDTSAFHL